MWGWQLRRFSHIEQHAFCLRRGCFWTGRRHQPSERNLSKRLALASALARSAPAKIDDVMKFERYERPLLCFTGGQPLEMRLDCVYVVFGQKSFQRDKTKTKKFSTSVRTSEKRRFRNGHGNWFRRFHVYWHDYHYPTVTLHCAHEKGRVNTTK